MKIIGKYFLWYLLIVLIIFRYFSSRPIYKNGDTVKITTTVFSDPIIFGNYQNFSAAGLKIYLPVFPEIGYGDKIIVEGTVDNGKVKNPKLISIDPSKSFGSGFRKDIIDFYQKTLGQPVSGLFAGITLGSKGALSSEFWEEVKDTGVAHVVVASGTNVTFVVAFIFGLSSIFLNRKKSIFIVILSIVLYLFLSGFQAPLIRAAIMAGFTFLAQSFGRTVNAWRVLFLTAGVMLFINPDWLVDLGFILSFVSTASIMIFEKKFDRILKFAPTFIREGMATSLAAQIGVSPILFVTFGRFNILSPIVNALVLWTIPYIMILSAVGGFLGLTLPLIGKIILFLAYPLGWWFVRIVALFARL